VLLRALPLETAAATVMLRVQQTHWIVALVFETKLR
jgi:hypothetical protein